MARSRLLNLCLGLSILLAGAALVVHVIEAPPGRGTGDLFVLASPVFLAIAAKKGLRFPRAGVFLAVLSVVLAGGALAAALSQRGG